MTTDLNLTDLDLDLGLLDHRSGELILYCGALNNIYISNGLFLGTGQVAPAHQQTPISQFVLAPIKLN